MNKSERIRPYQTSYQKCCFGRGHQNPFTACCVLCVTFFVLPSVVSNLEKCSKHLNHYQAAVVASESEGLALPTLEGS